MPGPGLKGYQNQNGMGGAPKLGQGVTASPGVTANRVGNAPTTAPGLKPPKPGMRRGLQKGTPAGPRPFGGVMRSSMK